MQSEFEGGTENDESNVGIAQCMGERLAPSQEIAATSPGPVSMVLPRAAWILDERNPVLVEVELDVLAQKVSPANSTAVSA